MVGFQKLALLQSWQRVPPTHPYYQLDLVEICGLASMVRESVAEVEIPVSPLDRDPLAGFERFMRRRRPELVGISSFTCGANSALELARIAKRHGAVVVLGGYHPSALPEECLSSPFVDVVVRGEGEVTFAELVRSGSPHGVAGTSYRREGAFVHEPDRALIDDLDALPTPLREIRPPRYGLAGLDYHTDTIYTSRGCPAKCTFCANNLVGKAWRSRDVHKIVEELLTIPPPRKGKWKWVKFWDSNFLTDAARIEELCDLIVETGAQKHFRFIAETRASDIVRGRGMLHKMRAAGFVRMGCGVESPNKETHKKLKKGLNLGHIQQAAELLTANDIHFSKFLIIGHPGESKEDILAYPDYSLGHGLELQGTTFFAMTPYPGTVLGEQYEKAGLVRSHDWDLYTNFCSVVELEGITPLELQALLCAVTLEYGMYRRFLKGQSFSGALGRLFEALLVHARVGLMHRDHSPEAIAQSLLWALKSAAGSKSRAARPGAKRRFFDRFALRFHCEDHQSVVVGTVEGAEGQELVIRSGPEGLGSPRKKELHVSTTHLVALAKSFDQRRTSSEILTLRWNLRAFRLRWLPRLLRDLGAVSWILARVLGFHVKRSLQPAREGRLRPVELPRPPATMPTPSPAQATASPERRGTVSVG